MSHILGPYLIVEEDDATYIHTAQGISLARIFREGSLDTAKLLINSPELLEACQLLILGDVVAATVKAKVTIAKINDKIEVL